MTATRSWSVTTPSSVPVGDRTGKWRTLRSSISSSTSPPSRSAPTVYAGALMAADTGASTDMPPATTRVRRSRSVRIPSPPSPSSMTIDVVPACVIRCAASRMESCGPQVSTGSRMSVATGWLAGSGTASGTGPGPRSAGSGNSSECAMNCRFSGRARVSRAAGSGIR